MIQVLDFAWKTKLAKMIASPEIGQDKSAVLNTFTINWDNISLNLHTLIKTEGLIVYGFKFIYLLYTVIKKLSNKWTLELYKLTSEELRYPEKT